MKNEKFEEWMEHFICFVCVEQEDQLQILEVLYPHGHGCIGIMIGLDY